MLTPFLSIEALTVSYGAIRVLDQVSLDVARGEMIALLGSSGCGKTTLLRAIAGFVLPESGAIRVDGRDIAGLPPERRGTAMMFQSYALWPHMTVAANIGYGLKMRSWKKDAIAARVDEMLTLLQLEGFGPRPVTQLSGGQRQRVAIARAFLKDAPILILDEATSHLDAVSEQAVRGALDLLARSRTTLVIAHRLSTVRSADRIIVLEDGRVAESGSHRELLDRGGLYAHLVSRQLASAAGTPA